MRKTVLAYFLVITYTSALTLQQALEYTLDNSPDLKISLADRTVKQSQLSSRAGAFLPTVDSRIDLVHDHYLSTGTTTDPAVNLWRKDYNIDITQNIFDGLMRYHDFKSAERSLLAYVHASKDQSFTRLAEVSTSYIRVMLAQETIELAKKNFREIKEIADLIDRRVAEGLSREIDRIQAQGRLATARANILASIANLHKSKSNFKMLTGGLEPVDLVNPDLSFIQYGDYQSYWDLVQERGSRLKQYAFLQDAAYYDYQASKGSFFPQINGVTRFEMRQNIDGNTNKLTNTQLGFTMTYNIYRGNQDFQKMYTQAQRYQQARFELKKQQNNLEYEAFSAWENAHVAQDTFIFHQEHANATAAVTRAYKDQFMMGQRSLLDLLDAQNEWYHALNNVAQQHAQLQIAQLQIAAYDGKILALTGAKSAAAIFLTPEEESKLIRNFIIIEPIPNV
jgi:adhesin transport system outer membrane protein